MDALGTNIHSLSSPSNRLTFFFLFYYWNFINMYRIIALRESGRQSDFVLGLSLVLWLLLRDLGSLVLVGIILSQAFTYAYALSPFFPHFFHIAAALVFGVMAGTLCNFATQLKFFAGYDDSLDVSFASVVLNDGIFFGFFFRKSCEGLKNLTIVISFCRFSPLTL